MKQVNLYNCRFKNTYSILVAAIDQIQAREVFIDFLGEREHLNAATISLIRVSKTYVSEKRPIYIK